MARKTTKKRDDKKTKGKNSASPRRMSLEPPEYSMEAAPGMEELAWMEMCMKRDMLLSGTDGISMDEILMDFMFMHPEEGEWTQPGQAAQRIEKGPANIWGRGKGTSDSLLGELFGVDDKTSLADGVEVVEIGGPGVGLLVKGVAGLRRILLSRNDGLRKEMNQIPEKMIKGVGNAGNSLLILLELNGVISLG